MKMTRVIGAGLVAAMAGVAAASLVRPDGATASSVFSSGYVIANAINGSGLPSGFGVASTHANYASGNHWTTQAGALAADNARATFTFNTDKTIDAFHLWNHRSNGVASDNGYSITRFDLVFKDAEGAVLATFDDLSAEPFLATAQHYGTGVIEGVRSVELEIEANNGSLNYTGLAEVAFNDASNRCGAADIAQAGQVPGSDGLLTADDIIVFIGHYFGGNELIADIAGPGQSPFADGELTVDDIIVFIGRFFEPCNV